jgi:cellulose synthase/poly-beta-1,6-N-acetylglucosamine synthase-like glycosyltransferase
MHVAVCVPVHGALEYVERTLDQIYQTTPAWIPLVVVDDASDAKTHDYLDIHVKTMNFRMRKADLLTNEKQQWFTRSSNRAIRYAYRHYQPDAIALVNSDVDLRRGWLRALTEALQFDAKIGIVGYRDAPDPKAKGSITRLKMPSYATGHCLLMRTKMLEEVGILCETDITGRDSPELAPYHGQLHIGSERILGYRANASGWGSAYCNFDGVRHEAGKSWHHDLSALAAAVPEFLWEPSDTLAGGLEE